MTQSAKWIMSHLTFGKAGLALSILAWVVILSRVLLHPHNRDADIISFYCNISALLFSLIGLWRDKPKKYAIAGTIVSGVLWIFFAAVVVTVRTISK